jgi:purine-binding chemotaxis protein CheW
MTVKVSSENAEEKKIIMFSLFDESMGIDISYVREILAPVEIHPLPNTPDFIEGVINLRKHIIAVVDLRKKFAVNSKVEKKEDYRIIICKIKDFIIGLIVDSVQGVVSITDTHFETMPDIISSKNSKSHILGIINIDDNIITILDINYILSQDEKTELSAIKHVK